MNKNIRKQREPKSSLQTRLAISFVAIATIIIGIILIFFYYTFEAQVITDVQNRLLGIAATASIQQNGDLFASITSSEDAAYQEIRRQNLRIRSTNPDIVFVYTMRYDEQGLYFVVDATNPGEPNTSEYGERYPEPGPVLEANYRTITKPLVENEIYTDAYGSFLSAYAPFYTTKGQLAGIIGVDISADYINASQNKVRIQILTIFLVSIPIIGLLGWIFGDRIAAPIKTLTEAVTQMSQGDFSYRPKVRTISKEIFQLQASFYSMADQMQSLIGNLEQRVTERTHDLEMRSTELQTAANIARDVSLAQNVDELLQRTAKLIRERFFFYHVGIFLIDDNNEYAILRAAGGEAGMLMLANKHKLRVGEVGIVGYVTKTGEPRIVLDVGGDAVHFRNPLLPYTRSEMTLPLEINGKVIGAVDIQSDKINAFDNTDIAILQILTDQLAISIEKNRLIQELQQSVATIEDTSARYTALTWRTFLQQQTKEPGYRYEGVKFEPIDSPSPEGIKAMEKGKYILTDVEGGKPGTMLAVPVRLRGQSIGTLNLKFQGTNIPRETIQLIEEAANRLALALENARLVQDARKLATREQQINIVSAQIQQSTDIETLLQNTVRELGNTLGIPKTFIQIGFETPTDPRNNPSEGNL